MFPSVECNELDGNYAPSGVICRCEASDIDSHMGGGGGGGGVYKGEQAMNVQSRCHAKPVTFFCNHVYLCACCPTRQGHSLTSEPDDSRQQPRDVALDCCVIFM